MEKSLAIAIYSPINRIRKPILGSLRRLTKDINKQGKGLSLKIFLYVKVLRLF